MSCFFGPSSSMHSRLLTAKLSPPAADQRQVSRDQITHLLIRPGPVSLVLVRAPAGFGKTTVMAQARQSLREEGMATAWLTLDAGDDDLSRLLAYLQQAVAELQPDMPSTEPVMTGSSLREASVSLIDRVAAIDFPFVLFLDEYESVGSPGVQALVGQLIEQLPRGGRLVIGCRTQPDLRLGRLRAAGQLLEIDAVQLRFSLAETRTFFDRRQPRRLAGSDLSLLHARTEGWAAALWLASVAFERIEHLDRLHDFISAFAGTEAGLANYLAEEVLAQQGEGERRFLLHTSVANEITVPLCQALLPDVDCQAMLAHLARDNMFMVPTEGEPGTWRYHSLFASFLRSELARELPDELPVLHERAAGAFLRAGRVVPAIDHLLAGGLKDAAVTLMREEAMGLLTEGRFRLLIRWLDRIQVGDLHGAPLLRMAFAWALGFTRGPQAAQALLENGEGGPGGEDAEVMAHWAALQPSLLIQMDRWEDAYHVGRRALETLPRFYAFADAALVNALGTASTVLGRFDEARRLIDRARVSQGHASSQFQRMYSEAVEGIVDLLDGRFRQARARFRLALQTSRAARVDAAHGNAWAGLLHAMSLYEVGDTRQAQQLLHVYLPLAREAWLPDHIVLGHQLSSRTAFQEGAIDDAFGCLSELEYLGHERRLPRFVAAARLERAWLLLRQGHADAAATELAYTAESPVWDEVRRRRHLAHDWDDIDIARARWELMAGNAERAALRLTELLEHARSTGQHRRALKLRLLLAMAQERSGDGTAALRTMMALLEESVQEAILRMFVDEGPVAGRLVQRAMTQMARVTDPLFADYLHRLSSAFGNVAPTQAAEPPALPRATEGLTAKELRLLQMLAEGYSNKALAEKLFVSDSTIRTHLRNINGKLGATSRTQAVALGRRYGLLG